MSSRFFCSSPIRGSLLTLADAEAHHLLHVMRAHAGDEVVVFDGEGSEFTARVVRLKRASVELEVLERRDVSRELECRLIVAAPLPKGDRQRWLVEKLVELGVTRFVPLMTVRSVARPEPSALDRLRKTVIEASKQCGRNRLMEIGEATQAMEFFAQEAAHDLRLLAHPAETPLLEFMPHSVEQIQLAVGPEGGWTEDEVTAARQAGWRTVNLGPAILRIETAAIALAARCALPF